jgi:hypothetical protein
MIKGGWKRRSRKSLHSRGSRQSLSNISDQQSCSEVDLEAEMNLRALQDRFKKA